jgi:hypothetical protein
MENQGKEPQARRELSARSPERTAGQPASNTDQANRMSKIADLYKDVWGHLPEKLRQEMDQYSRERFMAKYDDLLKQYYATIAEKGRRKGD